MSRAIRNRKNAVKKLLLDLMGLPMTRKNTAARTKTLSYGELLKMPGHALPAVQNVDGTFKYLTDYDAVDSAVVE